MPFNGSGQFNRLYSWVTDNANGINIDATRSDNELNGMATALSDCVTRDGQSPFTANIPAGGFKIINHGTPSSGTDVANKAYVDGVVQNEWKAETNSFAWVSGTQFQLTGVNLTAVYHVGRRLKIVHNGGASTAYATITATAFSTNTTVTVVTDDGSALVAALTAVSYGLVSYVNPSYLDPRTFVIAYPTINRALAATSAAKVTLDATWTNSTGEFSTSTSRFTAARPGVYLVTGQISTSPSSSGYVRAYLFKNGSVFSEWLYNGIAAWSSLPFCSAISLAAGDYLELWCGCQQNQTIESTTGNSPTDTQLTIVRIA